MRFASWPARAAIGATLPIFRVEIVEGSLEDAPLARRVPSPGCRYLFHVAADYRLWVPDPAPMYRANVEGTRVLMRAALDAGVERVVYTSSVATLGLVAEGSADEETPSSLEDMIGPYKRSKFQAEEVVRDLVERRGLPAVIVNPSTPVGPARPQADADRAADRRSRPRAYAGRMSIPVSTSCMSRMSRSAISLRRRLGRVGERYILGGENMSLARNPWQRWPRRPAAGRLVCEVPYRVAYPAAIGAELVARLTGREPFITLRRRSHGEEEDVSSARRRRSRELGYAPRPARDGDRRRGRLVQGQRIPPMTDRGAAESAAKGCRQRRDALRANGAAAENFPVGSLLIRRELRPHVHAFYRFARNADDIADNPALTRRRQSSPPRPHGGNPRRRARSATRRPPRRCGKA